MSGIRSKAEEINLSDKFRRDNYDQFMILVRMHLSFVLDLTTDENGVLEKGKLKKWNLVPFTKKSKSRGVMEGAPLTQEGICQAYQLIEFLKKEPNICVEGIFRRTGSLSRQQELRNLLNQGNTVNLESGSYSVHDCASVLKGFLAELPEPLLTDAHFQVYCQIGELFGVIEKSTQTTRLMNALQLLLLLLPSENRVLLKDLLELLNLTASYEKQNKMSADSLATLFTPHLLCPRKLSPEALHTNSQSLSGIISFMITNSTELFQIPSKLALDIKAYYKERERRRVLSPKKPFDESISDNCAATTVFSFVDHVRTSKENQSNPTETALAQLYAHIQSLPESTKKRKLIKQFNKENGHGTPLQVLRSSAPKSNKRLGESIKKHIFNRKLARNVPPSQVARLRSSNDNSPHGLLPKARLFCTKCDSDSDASPSKSAKKQRRSTTETFSACETKLNHSKRSLSESDLSKDENDVCNPYLTSTPACIPLHACSDIVFTPEDQGRKSMSPITRSTQGMSRAMQETMMTPRSRKPVLVISGTNITKLPHVENQMETRCMNSVEEESEESNLSMGVNKETKNLSISNCSKISDDDSDDLLSSTFRKYLCKRSMLTISPTDLSFSSQTDDYNSTEIKDITNGKLSGSLLFCLDGNVPEVESTVSEESSSDEKEFVLKPKQYDENGKPTVYETSF